MSPVVSVTSRKQQFMVARASGPLPSGVTPFRLDSLTEALDLDPEVDVKKRLRPRSLISTLSARPSELQDIIVAQMPDHRADQLKQHPQLLVEVDHPLTPPSRPFEPIMRDPGVITPQGAGVTVSITVAGRDGAILQGANVYLYGSFLPAQGVTDRLGQVQLTLIGDTPETLQGLYVDPRSDYWSVWIPTPAVVPGSHLLVTLAPLRETLPNFPQEEIFGWGQRAMGLDQLPQNIRGQGIRVAIIDSGAAATHLDLNHLRLGLDVTQESSETWVQDEIAHGSHCAGIIAGLDNGRGVRGFAPDAEVHILKVFPGGHFSDLIDALDYCIEHEVDVVNMSLGSAERSVLLEQKIQQAKQSGVACIVAAGNSAGPVQFPAVSPDVLAVAAIGKHGEFPADSYQATQDINSGGRDEKEEYFSARFTCYGPEIDVAGPGVAIVSSVPPDNFAAMDGTSMAAPHVTGAAALILAHHDDFRGPYSSRNAERVERLFDILEQSSECLGLSDQNRTGAGLPNVGRALALESGARPPGSGGSSPQMEQLRGVLQQAGLFEGAAGSRVRQAPTTPPQMEQLRAAMQQAGLFEGAAGSRVRQAPTTPPQMEQLRAAMQQAGLFEGAAGSRVRQAPTTPPQMEQLRAAMQQAGLLST